MKNYIFIISGIFLLLLSSCYKDSDEELGRTVVTQSFSPTTYNTEFGKVAGIVYTESKQPIANALINIAGQITHSDEDGLFYFDSAELDPLGSYIKAEKEGYILGSDFIYPGPGLNRSYIQMMALSKDKTFEASNSANIQIEGGGTVQFDPNSISTALGEIYTGTVYVTAKRLASDDPELADKMPGSLVASDKDHKTVVLGTYGMVAVELRDDNGEELNLSPGSKAKIMFPIADKDLSDAPDSIPLWHFDEENGIWLEEGSATRQGDSYEGEVSHFSFWNCDVPFPLIIFCVNIYNEDGTPANGVQITFCAGNLGTGQGYSCNGVVTGKIPKDEILTIKVSGRTNCGDLVNYSEEVGPFRTDIKLADIILTSLDLSTVSGTILCNGDPLANSAAVVSGDNLLDIIATDDNGFFEYNTCYNGELEIFGKNLDNNTGGPIQIVSIADNNTRALVHLETCSDCNFEAEIMIDQGIACDSLVALEVLVDGTSSYSYTWSNGSTSSSIPEATSGNYSVTILENGTDCSSILSTNIDSEIGYLAWTFDTQDVDCDTDNGGAITITASNGSAPYAYTWTGPNGGLTSTSNELTNLIAGTYSMTITDSNDCQIEGQVILPEAGINLPNIQGNYTLNCNESTVIIGFNTAPQNLTFLWTNASGAIIGDQANIEIIQPGIYTLTVTSIGGCVVSFENIITEDIESPYFEVETQCDGLEQNISVEVFGSINYSIELLGLNNSVAQILEIESYNIFDFTESSYEITVTNLDNACQSIVSYPNEAINVTSFEVTSSTAPTCNTCLDGQIVTQITAQDCPNCTIDIYKKENLEYVLVSTENTNATLGSGTYFVAYKDTQECVIEFLEVTF